VESGGDAHKERSCALLGVLASLFIRVPLETESPEGCLGGVRVEGRVAGETEHLSRLVRRQWPLMCQDGISPYSFYVYTAALCIVNVERHDRLREVELE